MEARAPPPGLSSRVIGPILVGNTLSWALWGLITAQLLAHLATRKSRRRPQQQASSSGGNNASEATSSALARVRFGLRPRGRRKEPSSAASPATDSGAAAGGGGGGIGEKMRKFKGPWGSAAAGDMDDAFARADVNPWTISFTPRNDGHGGISVAAYPRPHPSAPPSTTGMRGRLSHALGQHYGHRQAQNSTGTGTATATATGTSNSPLSPHPLMRAAPFAHTYPPAPPSSVPITPSDAHNAGFEDQDRRRDSQTISGLSPFLLVFLYALVCLQAIFGTVQFWHAVVPRSQEDTIATDWAVVAAADCVAPIGTLLFALAASTAVSYHPRSKLLMVSL